jgi:hypothetical protein
MEELARDGCLDRAALHADMDRKTARKYRDLGKLPSELKKPRTWRTRSDPFTHDWAEIKTRLAEAQEEVEARALLVFLMAKYPERYREGHLRTLQRRIRHWRATEGPPKEVFFPQDHRPGEAMQTDFTWGTELGITIRGEPFDHLICHPVLPFSNWEWVTVCHSESLAAMRRGVQEALFRLGHVPEWHQTDNSTAATHDLRTGKRAFNEAYVAMVTHFGMKPRTIEVGKKEQNGDVEALHRPFKARVRQALIFRDSKDFESEAEYEAFLQEEATKANLKRHEKVVEELKAMRVVALQRLPEFTEIKVRVSEYSTIRVLRNTYSVPSQLMGEEVRARVFEDRIEVWFGERLMETMGRLQGRCGHRINYHHVIHSLVRKPGAFERYRYREDLFPSLTFRKAYDRLREALQAREADLEYLRACTFRQRRWRPTWRWRWGFSSTRGWSLEPRRSRNW